VFAVAVKYVVTDSEVGNVCRRNWQIAGVHRYGREPVADERAVVNERGGRAAVVGDADAVALVDKELGPRDLGALVAGVARPVVDARLVKCHVDAVAEVVAERRMVKHAPASIVRYVYSVVLVVVESAGVHQYITWRTHRNTPDKIYSRSTWCKKIY